MGDESKFPVKVDAQLTGDGFKKAADEAGALGQKGEEAGKKMSEGAEKAGLSHRELREAVRGVGDAAGAAIPQLELLTAGGMAAGIGIVLVAFEGLKTALENLGEPAKRAAEEIAKIDAIKIKAAADAATHLRLAMQEVVDTQIRIRGEFERSSAVIDNQIKQFNLLADAQQRVRQAQERAFEEETRRKMDSHEISHEEGQRRIENARLGLSEQGDITEERKAQNELDQYQKQFDEAKDRQAHGKDTAAIAAAQGAFDEASGKNSIAQENLKAAKDAPIETGIFGSMSEEEGKKKVRDITKMIANEDPDTAYGHNAIIELEKRKKEIEDELKKHEESVKSLQPKADETEAAQAHAQTLLEQAKAKNASDAKLVQDGEEHLKALRKEVDLLRQRNQEIEHYDRLAAGSRVAGVAATAPETTLAEAEALLSQLSSAHGGTHEMHDRLINVVKQLHDYVRRNLVDRAMEARIATLENEVRTLDNLTHSTAHYVSQGGNTH